MPGWLPGPNERPDARCPLCQALERHRFLALVLQQLSLAIGSSRAVLDVAPQPQVRRFLTQLVDRRYVGVDLVGGRPVDVLGDVCRLPFPSGAFDLIVCYHVLEHVPDDASAMRELARVLRPGGFALVQVPYRSDNRTDEDPCAPVGERLRRFGQEDHVRAYGYDFEERLLHNGLQPWRFQPRDLVSEPDLRRMALMASETVWLCRASDGVPAPADWTGGLRANEAPVEDPRGRWTGVGGAGVRRLRRAMGRSALGPPLRRVRKRVRGWTTP